MLADNDDSHIISLYTLTALLNLDLAAC